MSVMRRRYVLFVLTIIFMILLSVVTGVTGQFATDFAEKPEHIVLVIVDGLSYKTWDMMELPNLERMAADGALLEKVYLPPAAHPRSGAYAELHSGSIPNPIMMSGTIFIDKDTEYLQESFYPEKTAIFIANARSYETISYNYHVTYQMSGPNHVAVEKTLEYMEDFSPVFTRLHLQDTGGAGTRSMMVEDDVPWRWNIWAEGSPYRTELARVDSLMGSLVQGLADIGMLDKTTFVICGDHGQTDTGWHPPEYDDSAITSCVVWGAGVKKGIRMPYAELIDIAPTIADFMGVRMPASSIGMSFYGSITGVEDPAEERPAQIRELNRQLSEYRTKSIEAAWLLEKVEKGRQGHLYLRLQRGVREQFYSTDRFSEWTDFSDIESLIHHNRDILGQLDGIISDIKAH